ncbi:MAG: NTP transferase domain-containing protein [Candidatus Latescibacteria bacterium]|nr:NTP transferase domain-containing protein [Candidatus Latescibacterota bacterium]
MKAIIIGAGRGIRLMPETSSYPKCMMDGLGGRRVLDWMLEACAQNGVDDIVFIGGYHIEKVQTAYPHLRFYNNTDWPNNNILESLMCAAPELDTDCLISYSDIVFRPAVVEQLLASPAADALVVDTAWRSRYQDRTDHGEDQAENTVVEDGLIRRLGKHVSGQGSHGEFIGLARLSGATAQRLRKRYEELRPQHLHRPFQQAATIRKAYLTDMLQEMIDRGTEFAPVDIAAGWAEIDTPQDLAWARRELGT